MQCVELYYNNVCMRVQSEDKKFKPPADPSGLMTVLQHVVQQPYFPKIARDTIRIYVARSASAVLHVQL